ncbi:MAG: acetyl-CoA carboxylase biotin carboxylase subunit [Lachnospiraceae bacterium]|nr:acetyl-CoA carboxylase biotin carboxylase subunit [Lachnospiraceae bacterium]
MFEKILIANRGEVAVRVIRACREMGIRTVAVYSDVDRDALHVQLADEAYCIGGAPVSESYLNYNAILMVARKTRAKAIHPGYGLLSENAEFAEACLKNGFAFIGPSPEVLRTMGDKDIARRTMKKAGLPVIEGTDLLKDAEEAKKAARKIGYPVLLKARLGGGGKGIRKVFAKEDLDRAFADASAEAMEAFGDGTLYMEKLLTGVKHIEVQFIADRDGKVMILGDRDCSIQYRNQKLIEEAPAPTLDDMTRRRMYRDAVAAAKAVKYHTVGTIEFLVQGRKYYFMEMNTRLQVEHSVTEMVCGIDIVKWQIRTAFGCPIKFDEKEIRTTGHALECRICAQDPVTFAPACGTIRMLHVPGGFRIRFDSALYQGYEVSPYYDAMLGKIITYSRTRVGAIRKMRSAIAELIVHGVTNNTEFHLKAMDRESFAEGDYTTDFVEDIRSGSENDGTGKSL